MARHNMIGSTPEWESEYDKAQLLAASDKLESTFLEIARSR